MAALGAQVLPFGIHQCGLHGRRHARLEIRWPADFRIASTRWNIQDVSFSINMPKVRNGTSCRHVARSLHGLRVSP